MVDGNFRISFIHWFNDVSKHTQTFFAFTYPYTYTECQNDLLELEEKYGNIELNKMKG